MLNALSIIDNLNTVRDLVEEARTSSDPNGRNSALRRAHAAISKTERDFYALSQASAETNEQEFHETARSWRTRKVSISQFDLYGLYFGLFTLLVAVSALDHTFLFVAAPLAVVVVATAIKVHIKVRAFYGVSLAETS